MIGQLRFYANKKHKVRNYKERDKNKEQYL